MQSKWPSAGNSQSMDLVKLRRQLQTHANVKRAKINARFFKTGKGEYGEGDKFLGLTAPQIRALAKKFANLSRRDLLTLLRSPVHEERMLALVILTRQFEKGDRLKQRGIYEFYLKNIRYINNWDLVDVSAYKILGRYLMLRSIGQSGASQHSRKVLYKLAKSKNLWQRRIAIVSTMEFIAHSQFSDTFAIARILQYDPRDLIHKATGWMLREVGKRDIRALERFLARNAPEMPRTALRYAIERFSTVKRRKYLNIVRKYPQQLLTK